ncbi:MAG: fibronectin type III domain-containing protein [Vicinamibacterales bacterium]
MIPRSREVGPARRGPLVLLSATAIAFAIISAVVLDDAARAQIPTRVPVRGTAPHPGTQQQELANITFPAPYNVFEFLVTCGACHGGQVDQQVAHFGNWAGTSMASGARDPVYRANQIIVNEAIKAQTGQDGAGNMCMRCHSPNGWYSGRFDPALNGSGDGSQMIHSILLSTDDEGVSCEMCHRTMGAVTFQRPDLAHMDAVWNMLAGLDDWPHAGMPFADQDGDPTIAPGNPYGGGALQLADGMTYIGRYPGTADISWADIPILDPAGTMGGYYTGQTYGIYPSGWIDQFGNDLSGKPATGAMGELLIQLDVPIGPPLNPNGTPNYSAQSVSPEHSTVKYPNLAPAKGFVQTSEFCGSCHDLTLPMFNHGMPAQRTYTEWKYSAFGREGPDNRTCQDCHMPRLSHEYNDEVVGSYNADPYGEPGGWPYSKPRTNTAVHKLAGANRDLPMMMKALYPEADIEVVGGGEGAGGMWIGTGNDPRIFPGMLSRRDPMWDRNQRNTEIAMRDGVDVAIDSGPTYDAATGRWKVQVKVTNNTGHRLPSGFSDGRRMWLRLEVKDAARNTVYSSGYYDEAAAELKTDPSTPFRRALSPAIDSSDNAVMVYERVTGRCQAGVEGDLVSCAPSHDALNDFILFDNRIPPYGFTYADYRASGVKFWNYDPLTYVPFEEGKPDPDGSPQRYPDGRNFDLVTYSFDVQPGVVPVSARVEVYWQTHSKEFMEHLRTADTSTVRPEGPPRPWSPNYPLDPNYLSDEFGLADVVAQMKSDGWLDVDESLRDNWGGIAYAAWYVTGKGAPYRVAEADTAVSALPPAVSNVRVSPQCDDTGACSGGVINPDTGVLEAYTQVVTWDAVPGADGYLVWIKYGAGITASWDKLAIVLLPGTRLTNTAINVNKTYVYKVQAFNGAGAGPASEEVTARTPWDLPLPPEMLRFVSATGTTITMSWYDGSDNEDKWLVFRGDAGQVDPNGYAKIAEFPSTTGFGGVPFTDGVNAADVTWSAGYTPPEPGRCYNYVVESANASGNSGWNVNGPVQMCTTGAPGPPGALTATAVTGTRIDLAWGAANGTVDGYRIEVSVGGGPWGTPGTVTALSFSHTGLQPGISYSYRVFAFNATAGDSPPSNVATAVTPVSPAPPSNLVATASAPAPIPPTVTLEWTDNSDNEDGFRVERALQGGSFAVIAAVAAGVSAVLDAGVEPKMTYVYRVQAFNASGSSDYSNETTVVTPGETPEAPTDLKIKKVSGTTVALSWADRSANELGFYVERSQDNGDTWSRVATMGGTGHVDNGLTPSTTYLYRVQAYNLDGTSGYSNVVTAVTKKR